jgi:fucose 4-O-acetylase-like acetyltransferase
MDNMTTSSTIGQRIDYIDALKGFLILSVVMCHVAGFCLGIQDDIPSFLPILFEFRNPPFFFISGFFAYKIGVVWGSRFCYKTIKKKFIAIAWPTYLFLAVLLYVHPSYHGRTFLHDNIKDLWFHWFTLSLFVFFVFYSIIELSLSSLKNEKIKSIILLACGALSYLLFSVQSVYYILPINDTIKQLMGMEYWGFFFFFILGVLARKHYTQFIELLNNNTFIAVCIFVFILFNIFNQPLQNNHFNLFRIITYLTGIILVLKFFMSYPPKGYLNDIMTFVGKRTLDIYLIHYFFLPLALYENMSVLRDTPMPIIEFALTFSISLVIIAMSLLVSYVIRLSPTSAYLILGYKSKNTKAS